MSKKINAVLGAMILIWTYDSVVYIIEQLRHFILCFSTGSTQEDRKYPDMIEKLLTGTGS